MRAALLAAFAVASAGCAHATFDIASSADNDAPTLTAALARRQLPAAPGPLNVANQPRLFAVTGGTGAGAPHAIVAFDLAGGKTLWTTNADVQSRIVVGGDFIVAREGAELVARDQASGAVRWHVAIPGAFIGAAADRERVYLAWRDEAHNKWWLGAYDGAHGGSLWKADADGQLGAPAAQGGLVYAPFLNQWLSIVDGKTGQPLARVRGLDEQISTVRVTSQVAYFGSRQGVFRLDARAATGTRAGSSYAKVALPPQLERTFYGRDAYDPIHQQYTAADRAHLLWSAQPASPSATGPLVFDDGGYAIHYFRFVFGYAADGTMRWAYDHPRVELVASTDTGGAIAAISTQGEVVALDPKTGAVRWTGKLAGNATVLGATFDADGWRRPAPPTPARPQARPKTRSSRSRTITTPASTGSRSWRSPRSPSCRARPRRKSCSRCSPTIARRSASRTPSSTCSSRARTPRACPCSSRSSRPTPISSSTSSPTRSARSPRRSAGSRMRRSIPRAAPRPSSRCKATSTIPRPRRRISSS